ncbi:MAG: ABC transporter permease [Oscillospiraceae bacterium]|jgi:cell division transport system permease protein|nr:ABC transporter permease [Oscillospiraceae bacterium]
MKNHPKRINAGYYIREGLASIFTHGFMSFASVFTIFACLIITGTFALLSLNISLTVSRYEDENIILAYVESDLSEAEAQSLKPLIESADNVWTAVFVSREQALKAFLPEGYENDPRYAGIYPEDFRHRFEVYVLDVADMAATQRAVAAVRGIGTVNANLTIAKGFVALRNVVTGASVALIIVLLIVSLFFISNTIKLATFERRDEIAIMRMVGATSGFIRWPFVFEGFILGVSGALAAFLAVSGLYNAVYRRFSESYAGSLISVLPFGVVSLRLCVLYVAVGLLVGVIGSTTAIRKYLKV